MILRVVKPSSRLFLCIPALLRGGAGGVGGGGEGLSLFYKNLWPNPYALIMAIITLTSLCHENPGKHHFI